MTKFDHWRKAYEKYLLGENFDPTTPDGKEIIASLDRMAMNSTLPTHVTTGYISPTLSLRMHALAYRTPGSAYFKKPETLEYLLQGVEEYEHTYGSLQDNQEGWWLAQVGDPLRILDVLFLLYDELSNQQLTIKVWTDKILSCQGAYAISSHGKAETGANLMWKCHIYYLLGILRQEQSLIEWANSQLPTMLRYSHRLCHPQLGSYYDDGFYPDGSFIQHYFFAYTGGYGKHLLNIFAGLLYAFRDCDMLNLSSDQTAFFCQVIQQAYAPLIVGGRFMDIARGREVSRYNYQDNICGCHVMRSLCYLSEAVPEQQAVPIRSLLRQWLPMADNRASLCRDEDVGAEYYVLPSLPEVLQRLESFDTPSVLPLRGHYNFGPMCKTVHRHGKWSAAISMYSKNTGCYETVGGESVGLWHLSDGMTYLYTSDLNQYNGDFYATVDKLRLPGTTVDRDLERASAPYFNWFMPESKNVYAFAGGAALGNYGSAGLQYRGQGKGKTRDLEVKKSWFFLGEEIVCLGSGITSTTGDKIETTVLNQRLLGVNENIVTLDGKSLKCADIPENAVVKKILHLSGNQPDSSGIGVVFPDGVESHVLCEHRCGTWNSVEIDPDFYSENDFATVWISHGTCPRDASYIYMLLPETDAEITSHYALDPDAKVLACCNAVHAVYNRSTQLLGINFWEEKPCTCAGITVDTQACILLHHTEDILELAVADPTKTDRILTITLDCEISEVESMDEGIEAIGTAPLKLVIDTTACDGRSLYLRAKR